MVAKAVYRCAVALLVSAAPLGCASGWSNPFSASKADKVALKTAASPAGSWTDSLTDNRVSKSISSAWKSGIDKVTPKPRVQEANDPLSLVQRPAALSPDLYISMAEVQEQAKNYNEAVDFYRKALKVDGKHLGAWMGLARLHDRRDQLAEATEAYRKAAEFHPGEAAVFNDLGLCYARQRKLEESCAALEKAIRLVPDKALYRNNIAIVLADLDRADEALAHLKHAHGLAAAHYNLGYFLQNRGREAEAVFHFTQAQALDPSLTQAGAWLAALDRSAGPSGFDGARVASAETPADGDDAAGGVGPYSLTSSQAVVQMAAPTRLPGVPRPAAENPSFNPAVLDAAAARAQQMPRTNQTTAPAHDNLQPLPSVEVELDAGSEARF